MMTKKHTIIVAVAVCAVALAALGSTKNPVERPLLVKATAVWLLNLTDGSAVCVQEGEATHLGRFTATGAGVWDLANLLVESGSGIVTAANKDVINWQVGPNNSVIFQGGTGRFSQASGGFSTELIAPPLIVPGPTPDTVTIIVEYVGTGTITY
jgi:hypothetical protein